MDGWILDLDDCTKIYVCVVSFINDLICQNERFQWKIRPHEAKTTMVFSRVLGDKSTKSFFFVFPFLSF